MRGRARTSFVVESECLAAYMLTPPEGFTLTLAQDSSGVADVLLLAHFAFGGEGGKSVI